MMDLRKFAIAALAGGLLAGSFDLTYACVWLAMNDRSPLWTLQSVASGWLGRAAFTGGVEAGALGFVSHMGISIVAAALYGLANAHLAGMRRHWIVCGALFGMLVYLFMNFVVMPLSNAPFTVPTSPRSFAQGFASHSLLFGIPIAWAARRWGAWRAS
jgi:uncharacterized membrane protein YagU involved in acid resistance